MRHPHPLSRRSPRRSSHRRTIRRVAAALLAAAFVPLVVTAPATAAPPAADRSIELPGAGGAEGIAAGRGSTFFAGDLATGDIFRGDVRRGTAALFIDAPDGRAAVGMKVDRRTGYLFVAGGATGQAYVYDTRSGDEVAAIDLAPGFINDVTITRQGAWFTNSAAGEIYLVPITCRGKLGDVRVLPLTGPAGETPGGFNLNGIASAQGGRTLLVAHSADATVYTVDPRTGASAPTGLDLPNVDGILVQGKRLWAVQNRLNQVSVVKLDGDLAGGRLLRVVTSPLFEVPTTVARFGNRLALPNAKFGVPDVTSYDVVVVRDRG